MTVTHKSSTLQHYNVKRHQLTNECLKTLKLHCGKSNASSLQRHVGCGVVCYRLLALDNGSLDMGRTDSILCFESAVTLFIGSHHWGGGKKFTVQRVRVKAGGTSCFHSITQKLKPNSITLSWSQTGPRLVADLQQRAGIWPII